MTLKTFFAIVLLNLIWGTVYAVSGYTIKLISPVFLYSIRFFVVFVLLFPFYYKFPENNFWKIFFLATMQAFCFAGLAIGLKYIDSSISGIILKLDIPLTIIMSSIFLNEKINKNVIIGILICFLAVFIMNKTIHFSNTKYLILLMFSSLFSATANVISKKIKNISYMNMMTWISLIMSMEMFLFSFFLKEKMYIPINVFNLKIIFALLYLIIFSSLISYVLFYYLLRNNKSSSVIPFGFFSMVISVVSGHYILGEAITINKVIGIILIFLGILISQLKNKK